MTGLSRGIFRVVCEQIVGWLFLTTAILKAAEPQDSVLAVVHVASLPAEVAMIAVATVIAVEIALGAALIAGIGRAWVVPTTIAVLLVFTLFLVALILTDGPVSCGCGGRLFDWLPSQWSREIAVVRNLFLITLLFMHMRTAPVDFTRHTDGRHDEPTPLQTGESA